MRIYVISHRRDGIYAVLNVPTMEDFLEKAKSSYGIDFMSPWTCRYHVYDEVSNYTEVKR